MKFGIVVLLGLMTFSSEAQKTPDSRELRQEARTTAQTALPTLAMLAARAPAAIGMSEREAAAARLDVALDVFFVPLDRLKDFEPAEDPRGLLLDVETVYFPVTGDGESRSSITVQRRGAVWVATDFGQPELTKRINMMRRGGDTLLIRVPALNLYLVGHDTPNGLRLTPLADIRGTAFRGGQSVGAAELFTALVPLARRHTGDPS
jgi:hypothetical protein